MNRCVIPMTVATLLGLCVNQASAIGFHHSHPYVDPYFNLDSSRRAVGVVGYGGVVVGTVDVHSILSDCGSRKGQCPPIENALLRLHIADCFRVEINGYPTKPQTLGGIHRNSRIYSLTGLRPDRISPCEIVVIRSDSFGNETRHLLSLVVRAGQEYTVRYPQDFVATAPQPAYPATSDGFAPLDVLPSPMQIDQTLPTGVLQPAPSAISVEPNQQ